MMKVPSSQSTNDIDEKLAYLLNPIRDLAKNWEIDIAAYLEKYLAELEGVAITFNDGTTTLNFAQAALLIQGTTCVYSKKVEYLYNLVFQMLELLSNKRKSQQQKNDAENDKEGHSAFVEMEENHFLSLDDIKEQKYLEMNENVNITNKRKSTLQLLPCLPTSLIPLEEGEKGNIILYNHKGEILGNKHDFRINICNVDKSGTLLFHMSDNLEIFDVPMPSTKEYQIEEECKDNDDVSLDEDCNDVDVLPNHTNDDIAEDHHNQNNDEVQNQTINKSSNPVPKETPKSLRRSARVQKLLSDAAAKTKIDAWKKEDPHEDKQQLVIGKGKTIRMSKKLQQKKPKNKKKQKKPAQLPPVAEFCAKAYFSHVPKFPKNYLKVPEMIEVEYIYWNETKNREKFWKFERKKQIPEEKDVEMEDENQWDDNAEIERAESVCDNFEPMNDIPNLLETDAIEIFKSVEESVKPENIQVVSSYETLVQKYVENYLSSAAQYCQITELARRVNEWEDKIQPKLQEEEKHEPFDIHVYGTRILDCYSNNNRKQTVNFSTMCKKKKRWEICRYFLATLQLANNYNVHITSGENMDTMELTLLSRKRHHDNLNEFQTS
ncbi:condensin-2 complex subunit H2 [Centruroides vittatus]|uniref:condensin-2 complex subunit H2 n=1 Tax=Centruroides vittatus TaxID=120091 RepID=UPI00350F883E